MTQIARTLYRLWTALLFAAVVVQIGAAGYGAFNAADKSEEGSLGEKAFEDGFDFHNGFGYIIFLGAVVLLLLALAGRLGRRRVLLALAAPLLLIVQIVLAWAGEDVPAVGIFHAVNAFVIAGLAGFLAHRAWTERS